MRIFIKYTAAFIAAVVLTALLSSIFSTQFVVAGLQSIGTDIAFATRLSMTIRDLAILQTLGIAAAACLLIGFLVAGLCHRFIGLSRTFWYSLAGATSLVTLLLLMSLQMQLMPIAGARTTFGLLTQAIAGGCGGWLFARLTRPSGKTS